MAVCRQVIAGEPIICVYLFIHDQNRANRCLQMYIFCNIHVKWNIFRCVNGASSMPKLQELFFSPKTVHTGGFQWYGGKCKYWPSQSIVRPLQLINLVVHHYIWSLLPIWICYHSDNLYQMQCNISYLNEWNSVADQNWKQDTIFSVRQLAVKVK